jgi:hypothetical protein
MSPGTTGTAGPASYESPGGAPLEALTAAIVAEVRLLDELAGVMRTQRTSVASDDLQGVDDSVFATHRILVTLGEARRQRRSLGRLVGASDDLGIPALDDSLGEQVADTLRQARDDLRTAALNLSREVEMNRQVLRGAIAAGGELMRGLYGGDSSATYARDRGPDGDGKGGGMLINRKA